jgi:hypothetical protein
VLVERSYCVRERADAPRPASLIPAPCWDTPSGSADCNEGRGGWTWRPLPRTWPSWANKECSAPLGLGRDEVTDMFRSSRGPSCYPSLCHRQHADDRASIRVWCSHTLQHQHVEIKSGHATGRRLRPHRTSRKKSSLRSRLPLDHRGPSMSPLLSSSFCGLPRLMPHYSYHLCGDTVCLRCVLVAS